MTNEIPIFDRSVDYFLNRSVILYGASNSGKSTIMKDILSILRPHIPNVCVICPTNELNGSYNEIIPKPLIHPEVTEQLLDDILKSQSLNVKLHNIANDMSKLEQIYNQLSICDPEIKKLKDAYEFVSKKTSNLAKLQSAHSLAMINTYKKAISRSNRHNILSESDKVVVKHININPNFLIIIDDAAVSANKWCKFNSTKELFFNGRHHKITFMIAFQDDKPLDSMLRKNAFINIFTTEQVCNTYFNRPANNFTKREKTLAEIASSKTFNDNSDKYKKLVYLREADNKFRFYTAQVNEDFVFGSAALIKYCELVIRNNSEFNVCEFEKFL
jgi:energy-coupling factor transporter ATP-binding protein EcfA2